MRCQYFSSHFSSIFIFVHYTLIIQYFLLHPQTFIYYTSTHKLARDLHVLVDRAARDSRVSAIAKATVVSPFDPDLILTLFRLATDQSNSDVVHTRFLYSKPRIQVKHKTFVVRLRRSFVPRIKDTFVTFNSLFFLQKILRFQDLPSNLRIFDYNSSIDQNRFEIIIVFSFVTAKKS